ncbi:hypothetical protein EW145_g6011 [Phellinidium pouzarii]|uniref:Uncharacterized protein n=1 Tax=Phellinidium pouzarii TaxID=167371 RepID=A0A4S4KY93_9AGAM|nr:hypothetical protein EW145_g6011 [Phellinidium pouzarii]
MSTTTFLNMRARFASSSLPFSSFTRSYATRRPVKPPVKIVDPLTSSSNASIQQLSDGVTFIYRPPPSAPSPFSTTVRPASPLLRPSSSSSSSVASADIPVPPRVKKERIFPSNHVLSEADFVAMRELRASDPVYYTRTRLAKEFKCSPFLVGQKVPLDKTSKTAALEKIYNEHAQIREKWGEQKSMAVAIRKKRREFW